MRTLLIVDGMNLDKAALNEARALCGPGDKLTVLAVAERPPSELLGSRPNPVITDPLIAGAGALPSGGLEAPVIESEAATEQRVSGELRDQLDRQVAKTDADDVEVWTQAIVRDEPAAAVAAYVRSSDVARIVLPSSSLDRIREILTGHDGEETLNGHLAPVILLPS